MDLVPGSTAHPTAYESVTPPTVSSGIGPIIRKSKDPDAAAEDESERTREERLCI